MNASTLRWGREEAELAVRVLPGPLTHRSPVRGPESEPYVMPGRTYCPGAFGAESLVLAHQHDALTVGRLSVRPSQGRSAGLVSCRPTLGGGHVG